MAQPILYGHPISPYVRKARLTLMFYGVDFHHEMNLPHAELEGFCKASPLGRIPAFSDDKVSTADSTVIMHYVSKFYGNNTLFPQDPEGYTQTLWFEEYADTIMTPAIAAHLFAEVVLAGRLFPRAPIQADIDKALNVELPKIYAFLDKQLEGREWLVGSRMTLADIAVASLLIPLYHCGQVIPDTAPNLAAYVQRFFALPIINKVISEEVVMLKAMKYDSPLAT